MSKRKINQNNEPQFLLDIKEVSEVTMFAQNTADYFSIKKKDVLTIAENKEIRYYLTREIFRVKRLVMVVF